MSDKGKTQLTIIFTATPDLVDEGDRIWELHEQWMAETHARDGVKALLSYNIAKGPETSNPLDPSSEPTGNTCYALNEVYESQAGVDDHWQQAQTGSTSATYSPGPANAKSQPCTARRSSVRTGKRALA